jgi:hypothetical protein
MHALHALCGMGLPGGRAARELRMHAAVADCAAHAFAHLVPLGACGDKLGTRS